MNNFDMFLIIALSIGAVMIVWQILVTFSKSRISLKHDLEILNLLPSTSVYADKLRKRVEARLKKNYGEDHETSWLGFAFAAIIFAVFAVVAYLNFTNGRMMVASITAGLCLLSLMSAICQLAPGEQK